MLTRNPDDIHDMEMDDEDDNMADHSNKSLYSEHMWEIFGSKEHE
jgi:hypothetical protein